MNRVSINPWNWEHHSS